MRHRIAGKKFNRDTNARKNMLSGLVRSLVEHGKIVTTQAKAKEVRRLTDKLVSIAQRDDTVAARRRLHRFFGKRDVVNTLVDRIAPLFTDRVSGFTTIQAAGIRRGDNTALFQLSFVKMPEVTGALKAPSSIKEAATVSRAASAKKAEETAPKPAKKAPKTAAKKEKAAKPAPAKAKAVKSTPAKTKAAAEAKPKKKAATKTAAKKKPATKKEAKK